MADYNERVAERIVLAREREGIPSERLALLAGISVKQMRRIEKGESVPRLSTIRKIAKALNIQVTDIRPDLDVEEEALQERLDEIDLKLDLVLRTLGVSETDEQDYIEANRAAAAAEKATERERAGTDETASSNPTG